MTQRVVDIIGACLALGVLVSGQGTLAAQAAADVARERADYMSWLTTNARSPMAAVAQQPVGEGVRLGPKDSEIPLPGIGEHRVFADRRGVTLETPTGKRLVSRNHPIRLGDYTLYLSRSATGTVLTVFGANSGKAAPGYYPYDPSLVFTGRLLSPESPRKVRVLAADGIPTEATEAGSVLVPLAGGSRLRVLRVPSGEEENELEIFFEDETNGAGSYPAGRFVSLIPLDDEKFRLDFNRARNPFCAYSTVYPCPAPWRGNVIRTPVRAGERYAGGGLEGPPPDREGK
jgi:hypothetical protein